MRNRVLDWIQESLDSDTFRERYFVFASEKVRKEIGFVYPNLNDSLLNFKK